MTQLTKTEFDIQTAALFPTNGVGAISALDLRTQITNLADSVPFKLTGNTSPPTADDDALNNGGNGAVEIGDIWVDETNNQAYICLDNTAETAIWTSLTSGGGGSLVDGTYGDITVTDSGLTWTLNTSVVTLDKLGDISNDVLLGRISEGPGPVEELNVAAVQSLLGIVPPPYDLRFGFVSTPITDEVIDTIMIPRTLLLPANLAGSLGRVGVNPTASFAMTIKDDGVTIATITVNTSGVFSFTTTGGTSKTVAVGSVLTLVAPTVVDSTVANMTMTILGSV